MANNAINTALLGSTGLVVSYMLYIHVYIDLQVDII